MPPKGKGSPIPNGGLGLFIVTACDPTPVCDKGLLLEVKKLSMEQSPIRVGILEAVLFSRAAVNSDKEGNFMLSRGIIP